MKIIAIISKSLKEQTRSFWILILSLSMGPFFIGIYYLITESSKPQYDVLLVNQDAGRDSLNHGQLMADYFTSGTADTLPLHFAQANNREEAVRQLKDRKADAVVVISPGFTSALESCCDSAVAAPVEFIGDLTRTEYLVGAVWANEWVQLYAHEATQTPALIKVTETALGVTGNLDDFDMVVPGILMVSLIMLMFTSSIAFVAEVENRTLMRLKLSQLTSLEFAAGIGTVQLLVGICSMLFTLVTALLLGFNYSGSLWPLLVISALTSLSLVAFSLIIAGLTRSANEVLVVGNFPMFLFMFFTGAAFPIQSKALFTLGDYPVTLQGLMSPSHAISALNKTLMTDMAFRDILPEITAIVLLTGMYFSAGAWLFWRRHMKPGKAAK